MDAATDGRVGYVYVQSTGVDAQNELVRQFMAQWTRDGLIVDERFNSGGQIPDRFIELLNRPMLAYWAVRDGAPRQWPPVAVRGPMVMLINGWSGSGGDAFPFYFREAKLGPLVGTRTWGGLDRHQRRAGAGRRRRRHRARRSGCSRPNGKWFAEGHGVEPDIAVDEDPSAAREGRRPAARARDQRSARPARSRRRRRRSGPTYERRVPVVPPPTAQQQ